MPDLTPMDRGKHGEDLACDELTRGGYAIVARRYRTKAGEIDIVARDGPTWVFVEVKARTSERFGTGAEAVTAWKQRKLVMMAKHFIAAHRIGEAPCRFDVVSIDFGDETAPRLQVIQGAFMAET